MTATVRGISVEGRSGSFTDSNGILAREYALVYKVVTDSRNDGPTSVLTAVGIPSIGDLYTPGNDIDVSAVAVSKSASQGDSPFEWDVEVNFSTDTSSNPATQVDNPLLQPPQISYSSQHRRILIPGYYNSPISPNASQNLEKGIVSSNGELLVPQPEMDIIEPVLVVQRNIQSLPSGFMAIANTVNSSPFSGADPRQLRMHAPEAQSAWHKAVGFYWSVQYGMSYKWDTWDIKFLNQGTYYLNSTGKKVGFATTGEGIPYIGELTSTGGKNSTSTPTFTRLRVYREIDFNSLGII